MVAIGGIIAFVFAVSFFTFVAFFGRIPALRSSPVGYLHRIIWRYIPGYFMKIDKSLTGGRISRNIVATYRHLLYEKHPVVLLFFVSLITGSAILFLSEGWTLLSATMKLGLIILLPQPYIFLYLCNQTTSTSPHIITPETHKKHISRYPFDYELFHPDIICRTCNFEKPARSKHCSLCKACVARADHHCIWVNNCVGEGNYKHFIALLASTTALIAYGAFMCYATLAPQIQEHFEKYVRWHHNPYEGRTDFSGRVWFYVEHYLDVLGTAFDIGGICRGGVGFLCLLTAPLPFGLLAYHVYLIWAGMTTNESSKWGDWKEDILDDLVWITDLDKSIEDYTQPWTSWPKRSSKFLILTNDGKEPRLVSENIYDIIQDNEDAEWHRVKSPKELDNIYDIGFLNNLKDVLLN